MGTEINCSNEIQVFNDDFNFSLIDLHEQINHVQSQEKREKNERRRLVKTPETIESQTPTVLRSNREIQHNDVPSLAQLNDKSSSKENSYRNAVGSLPDTAKEIAIYFPRYGTIYPCEMYLDSFLMDFEETNVVEEYEGISRIDDGLLHDRHDV